MKTIPSRKLKRSSVMLAQKNASASGFNEKFVHPRRDRIGPSLNPSPFVNMLRDWRASEKPPLYAKQAAQSLGVPVDTYNKWEQGKHMPSPLALETIRQRINESRKRK